MAIINRNLSVFIFFTVIPASGTERIPPNTRNGANVQSIALFKDKYIINPTRQVSPSAKEVMHIRFFLKVSCVILLPFEGRAAEVHLQHSSPIQYPVLLTHGNLILL